MLKILCTSFNRRSLNHWLPLLDFVRDCGGECDYLFFPRMPDPDSQGLAGGALSKNTALCLPIGTDFDFVDANKESCQQQIIDICLSKPYDAVLMATCVGGPELKLKQWIKPLNPNLTFVGLQHGFVQTWPYYESLFESFDRFGVFGRAFASRFSPAFLSDIVTMALPQLDVANVVQKRDGHILFALQLDMETDVVRQLAREIEEFSGRRVVLRPHPEYVSLYDGLRSEFAISEQDESSERALSKASALVTSGSTMAIQALDAGIPTAVIDHLRGSEYKAFGIVAKCQSGAEIARILRRQCSEFGGTDIKYQLEQHTGVRGIRIESAYSAMLRALEPKGWRDESLRINRTVLNRASTGSEQIRDQ